MKRRSILPYFFPQTIKKKRICIHARSCKSDAKAFVTRMRRRFILPYICPQTIFLFYMHAHAKAMPEVSCAQAMPDRFFFKKKFKKEVSCAKASMQYLDVEDKNEETVEKVQPPYICPRYLKKKNGLVYMCAHAAASTLYLDVWTRRKRRCAARRCFYIYVYMSSYYCMARDTCYCICVLVLLYTCPHTTIYVSSY
jgi:hypothetical protein